MLISLARLVGSDASGACWLGEGNGTRGSSQRAGSNRERTSSTRTAMSHKPLGAGRSRVWGKYVLGGERSSRSASFAFHTRTHTAGPAPPLRSSRWKPPTLSPPSRPRSPGGCGRRRTPYPPTQGLRRRCRGYRRGPV